MKLVERLQLIKGLCVCSGWFRHQRVDDGSFLLRKIVKRTSYNKAAQNFLLFIGFHEYQCK